MISYDPFWQTLIEKGISQYHLIYHCGISSGTLDSLRKGRPISTKTLGHLCAVLSCSVEEVLAFVPLSRRSANAGRA